jgi:LAO/AO transport system ATPase
MPEPDALIDRFRRGDRRALARLLTLLSRGEHVEEISAALPAPASGALVVAITGSAGVGKSTLVGRLIEVVRRHGRRVAVLACDPQSPLSGGALLGDRFRMPGRPEDEGVFIRSLAAPSGRGAVAEHLGVMVRLLEAFGFDVVLIETVGAGQGDTAVRGLGDVVVLLLQPETGDDLQWEKAGVLEVADVVAVHKADLPGSEHVAAQVRSALNLPGGPAVPVVRVSAKTGLGLEELWQAITAAPRRRAQADGGAELLQLAQEELAARWAALEAARSQGLQQLADLWRRGVLSRAAAGGKVLELVTTMGRHDGTPGPVGA